MNEFAIEWTKDRDFATVTVPSGTAWKSKLMRYSKDKPESVQMIVENKDGSAVFHVPIKWIKCSPPRKISDEQKEAAAERFKQMWKREMDEK